MLLPYNQLKGLHYLHLVFPILLTIGVMPDLFLSTAEKTDILNHYYAQNKYFITRSMGWFPAGFVQPVSILVGIVYGIATLVLISLTKKGKGLIMYLLTDNH